MTFYLYVLSAGFFGSFHCIGMCSGFACALGQDRSAKSVPNAIRHLLYNFGRISVYIFLGAAAGGIIEGIKPKFHSIDTINILQQALSLLAGALMIVMGLKLLRVFSIRPLKRFNGFGGNLMVQALSRLVASQHRATPLALGVFNGFLPCPLIYAFLAQSAATGSAASGALTMFSLGLGTFPAMLFMGWIGTKLTFKFRHLGVQFAGFMILMFGIITIARAFVPIGSMKHMG